MADVDQTAEQTRIARNQALLREVNERVQTLQDRSGAPPEIDFLCECADMDCAAPIALTRAEYESLRSHPARFVVKSEHVYPEAEIVVATAERYWIVEKIEHAAEVVTALDARTAGRVPD